MEFQPKALKSDEHRARHPLGRVPVLEDSEVMLYESGAIVEYVIARYSNGALKPAVDSPLFPRYLQWFHYCEGMVMPPMNTIIVQTLFLPQERRNAEILGQAKHLLMKTLDWPPQAGERQVTDGLPPDTDVRPKVSIGRGLNVGNCGYQTSASPATNPAATRSLPRFRIGSRH